MELCNGTNASSPWTESCNQSGGTRPPLPLPICKGGSSVKCTPHHIPVVSEAGHVSGARRRRVHPSPPASTTSSNTRPSSTRYQTQEQLCQTTRQLQTSRFHFGDVRQCRDTCAGPGVSDPRHPNNKSMRCSGGRPGWRPAGLAASQRRGWLRGQRSAGITARWSGM